ncbi:MAG: hypothetical protein K6G52_05000 [Treponemataceae bacterium]|nr:hypothetical protein [Treponemataceae bacterium]
MKKFILILLVCFSLFVPCFAAVDIDLPVNGNLAISEISFDGHESYSHMFMYLTFGPIRAQYVFEENVPEKWTFGVGGSFFFWPFFNLSATGSANYTLCTFENGSTLELSNMLEIGLFMYLSHYYNVETENGGYSIMLPTFGPSLSYNINLIYRMKGFYCGGGFYCAGTGFDSSMFIVYGADVVLGWRIPTKKSVQ